MVGARGKGFRLSSPTKVGHSRLIMSLLNCRLCLKASTHSEATFSHMTQYSNCPSKGLKVRYEDNTKV